MKGFIKIGYWRIACFFAIGLLTLVWIIVIASWLTFIPNVGIYLAGVFIVFAVVSTVATAYWLVHR